MWASKPIPSSPDLDAPLLAWLSLGEQMSLALQRIGARVITGSYWMCLLFVGYLFQKENKQLESHVFLVGGP